MPIVLLILLSALHAVDPNLERAALGLGSSRVRVFLRVVLPIALPGVLSAALFAFLTSFDELLISLFVSGVRAQTLPVRIWNSLNLQVEPTIARQRVPDRGHLCGPGGRQHPAPSSRKAPGAELNAGQPAYAEDGKKQS
jgi:hypothetical protein